MITCWIMRIAGLHQPVGKAGGPVGDWGLKITLEVFRKECVKHRDLGECLLEPLPGQPGGLPSAPSSPEWFGMSRKPAKA